MPIDVSKLPNCLMTVPANAFDEISYLNFSHPLKVRLKLVKRFPDMRDQCTRRPPPCIGVKRYQNIDPTLDAASARTFWGLHFRYHSTHPKSVRPSGSKKRQREDSSSEPQPERGVKERQSSEHRVDEESPLRQKLEGGLKEGEQEELCQCKVPRVPIESSKGVTAEAPWGIVGNLRIGIDIPATLQSVCFDASDTSDDEDDYQTFHLSGLMDECENMIVKCECSLSSS